MNEADSLFVDRNQKKLRIVWIRLLDLKEGRAEGWSPEYHLEEGDLGLLRGHSLSMWGSADSSSLLSPNLTLEMILQIYLHQVVILGKIRQQGDLFPCIAMLYCVYLYIRELSRDASSQGLCCVGPELLHEENLVLELWAGS